MKKEFSLLFLVLLLVACDNSIDNSELPQTPSTLMELKYPSGMGHSDNGINGLLGYGYDLTGFCDTISVKNKIFSTFLTDHIVHAKPYATFPILVSAENFNELLNKFSNTSTISQSSEALSQHINSLLKLARDSNNFDANDAFTYYAITYIQSQSVYFINPDYQQYLSPEFNEDVDNLSPKELVAKYGTHVIIEFSTGTKFEVLYHCRFSKPISGDECKNLFLTRMKEFTAATPGIIATPDTKTKNLPQQEEFIYNSLGSRKKMCGIIHSTNYNPDSIRLDVSSLFADENIKTQFIAIGSNGLLPIYDLINNETKKQEVKSYIEKYLTTQAD